MLSSKKFTKELISIVKILELRVVFQSCEADDNVKATSLDNNFINIPEQLCLKYRNFFNINKAE